MPGLRAFRRHYRTVYGALALGAATTLLVLLLLQNLPIFSRTELIAYDYHFLRRTQHPVQKNIVVVALDETSFQDLSNGNNLLPRRYTADVVNYLHRAGARVIALDLVYRAPTRQRDDQALAAAIRRAGNVVLASDFPGVDANIYLQSELKYEYPIDQLARWARGVGVVNFPPDQDGTVRQSELVFRCPGGSSAFDVPCPSFALEVASAILHRSWQALARTLPDPMLVNYLGPQPPLDPSRYTFRPHQFESVAVGQESARLFRNKIVLVMESRLLTTKQFNTPYGEMYGGVLQANALNTILARDYITSAGDTANSLLLLLVGLVTTIVASRFGIYRGALGVLLVLVGYAVVSFAIFDQFRVWINLITPETAGVLSFASIMALRFGTEERQKRRTSKIFSQYVKPEIVNILVNAPDEETALAGARRTVSVLFVDVRGFTRMSEAMDPEDVVAVLDIYLEQLTLSVTTFDGTVDKYVGDELMAIWNAPRYQADHALRAVQAGLDMVSRMDAINDQLRQRGLPAIKYGIGINSGQAVVGQMGSSMRKQYTVIGDTVNTAARLCGAAGGAEIIIGESTWEQIGRRLDVEETEALPLKGKSQAIRTFRVIGIRPEGEVVSQPTPATV